MASKQPHLLSYTERYCAALALLCDGRRPDPGLVVRAVFNLPDPDWKDGPEPGDELQAWAAEHAEADWMTGIAVLNAAACLAEECRFEPGVLDKEQERELRDRAREFWLGDINQIPPENAT